MLALEIASFESGARTYELTPTPDDLDLDPEVFRDIRLVAQLDRTGDRIYARLEVSGIARLQCDRTLVDYDQDLAGEHGLLFASAEELDDLGGHSDEVREFDPKTDDLDITESVRDTLLLSIPLRRIAPGADSVEISTSFGDPGDEAVDPRWEALRSLKQNSDEERP